jgi:hypothetical protein
MLFKFKNGQILSGKVDYIVVAGFKPIFSNPVCFRRYNIVAKSLVRRIENKTANSETCCANIFPCPQISNHPDMSATATFQKLFLLILHKNVVMILVQ